VRVVHGPSRAQPDRRLRRVLTLQFRRILRDSGVETVLTPCRAPNCNAFAKRFVRSIKEECLDRMVMFGVGSLRRAIREYAEHYPLERPHQGLGSRVIERASLPGPSIGSEIRCEERLGGLLKHYRRAASRWDTTGDDDHRQHAHVGDAGRPAPRIRIHCRRRGLRRREGHPRLAGPVHFAHVRGCR
jgi:hypothetical protein